MLRPRRTDEIVALHRHIAELPTALHVNTDIEPGAEHIFPFSIALPTVALPGVDHCKHVQLERFRALAPSFRGAVLAAISRPSADDGLDNLDCGAGGALKGQGMRR